MVERRSEIKPTITNTVVQLVGEEMEARKATGSKFFPAITPEFVAVYILEKTGKQVSLRSIKNALQVELTPNLLFYLGDGVWIPQENGFFPLKTYANENRIKKPSNLPKLPQHSRSTFRPHGRHRDDYYRP